MTTELGNFDASAFSIQEDPELDLEDNRLDQELKQLIAEQLDDFDLGDEKEDDQSGARDEQTPDLSDANEDDLASILAAGKLSLLEKAIKGLAGSDPQISDRTGSGHENSVNAPDVPYEVCTDPSQARIYNNASSHRVNSPFFIQPGMTVENSTQSDMHGVLATDNNFNNNVNNIPDSTHWDRNDTTARYGEQPEGLRYEITSSLPPPPEVLSFPTAVASSHVAIYPSHSNPPDLQGQIAATGFRQPAIDPSSACSQFPHIMNGVLEQADYSDNPTSLSPHSRRELLYVARGQQLEHLNAELLRVQEEAARDKRVAAHRLMLAEEEKQALCSKLTSAESLVENLRLEMNTRCDQIEKLKQQLTECERTNKELTTELSALRSTNESLSTQLVELTKGDAIRRVEEREGRLTEALERRYMAASNSLQTELQTLKQKLQETEQELRETARQLEATKADAAKARSEFHETTIRSTKQLEELQSHCQKLASSALCTEVTSLRQKVSELETAKKISEDVNQILQDELHDLRQQVDMYESVLNLDQAGAGDALLDLEVRQSNQSSPLPGLVLPNGRRHGSIEHMVTFTNDLGPCRPESAPQRPASALERTITVRRSNRGIDEFNQLHEDEPTPTETARRDLGGRRSHPSGSHGDHFRPLSRHGLVTSTPSSTALMGRIRAELNRCLSQYKSKREQITQLHEAVFTTRCQLHQALENANRMEKQSINLQDRVLSLERDLAAARELNETPGPRESVLQGQLERIKSDYSKLEEELQSTRIRLQAALGAEARALEAEKATAERLAASVAERDAAVERTRSVCDAHYAAMRRQMEMNWANEREATARQTEELMDKLKRETADRDNEINRLTKLCQEAEQAAQQAVESALYEAMQEREAERIRFWREELPNQLKIARLNWDQEWKERSAAAVRDAVEAYRTQYERKPRHLVHVAVQTSLMTANANICTESELQDCKCVETDMAALLQSSSYSTDDSVSVSFEIPQALLGILGNDGFTRLRLHLLESPLLSLSWLDQKVSSFFRELFTDWWRSTWSGLNEYLLEYGKIYQIPALLLDKHDPNIAQPSRATSLPNIPDTLNRSCGAIVPSWLWGIDKSTIAELDRSKTHVLTMLQYLCSFAVDLTVQQQCVEKEPPNLSVLDSADSHLVQQLYFSAVEKIKREVLDYVHTCQTRAAQTLNSQIGRVHRRACRQFANQLRQALLDDGFHTTVESNSLNSIPMTRHPNGLPRSTSPAPRPRTPRTSTALAVSSNVAERDSLSRAQATHTTSVDRKSLLQLIDCVRQKLESTLPRSDSSSSTTTTTECCNHQQFLNNMMSNWAPLQLMPNQSASTGDTLLTRGQSDTDPSETLCCAVAECKKSPPHPEQHLAALSSLGDTHVNRQLGTRDGSPLSRQPLPPSEAAIWEVCRMDDPVAFSALKEAQDPSNHSTHDSSSLITSTAPLRMRYRIGWDTVGPPLPSIRQSRAHSAVDSVEVNQPPITAMSRLCRLPECPPGKSARPRDKGSRTGLPIILANYPFARQDSLPQLPLFTSRPGVR